MTPVFRFAPSPTGLLHLGHAYSALFTWDEATAAGGRCLLRIEDIDLGRCRPEFETAITEDLAWLGLSWETPIRRQSAHMDDYRAALDRLAAMDLLYPCFCTRKEIQAEVAAAPNAPHGPDGPLYPGTCKRLNEAERKARLDAGDAFALRLHVDRAAVLCGPLSFSDARAGTVAVDPAGCGDVVLARKGVPTSYHLAVVVDDGLQGVTHVTRGEDLLFATHVHRVLQAILDLPEPAYHHHRLLLDDEGKRFAKPNKSVTLQSLRAQGTSPADIRRMIGLNDG